MQARLLSRTVIATDKVAVCSSKQPVFLLTGTLFKRNRKLPWQAKSKSPTIRGRGNEAELASPKDSSCRVL